MEREPIKIDFDAAEIWRTAQQLRAEDMSAWLRIYFERRRQRAAKARDDASLPEGHPALK